MRSSIVFMFIVSIAACSATDKNAAGPKLAASQPQCDYVNYHRDETVNVQGSGKCTTDCDCDGMRSCTDGTCSGTARPTITCASGHCQDAPAAH